MSLFSFCHSSFSLVVFNTHLPRPHRKKGRPKGRDASAPGTACAAAGGPDEEGGGEARVGAREGRRMDGREGRRAGGRESERARGKEEGRTGSVLAE